MNKERISDNFDENTDSVGGGFEKLADLADRMGDQENLDDDFEIYDGSGWSDEDFDDFDSLDVGVTEIKNDDSVLRHEVTADDDFVDLEALDVVSQGQDYEKKDDETKIREKIAKDRELIQGIIERLGDKASKEEIINAIEEKSSTSRFEILALSDEVVDEFGLRETIGQHMLKHFNIRNLCLEFGQDFLDKYGIRDQAVSAFLNTFDNILDKTTISSDAVEHFYDDEKKKDIMLQYMFAKHPIENFDGFCRGIEENVLPNLTSDEELRGLGDDHADLSGDSYGVDDYKIKCLTETCTPRTFNELMMIEVELPSSDFNKRAQNRADALAIEGKVIGSHSFIHEERPGIHLIMKTMAEFYDACKEGNEEKRDAKREELSKLDLEYKYGFYSSAVCVIKDSMEDVVKTYEQKAEVSRRESCRVLRRGYLY